MSVDVIHALLAIVFAGVWLLVWQILCRSQAAERRAASDARGESKVSSWHVRSLRRAAPRKSS